MVMQVRRTLSVGAVPTGLLEGQISVGMADQPPTAWVGVPTSVNPAGVIPITGLVRTVAGAPQPAGALGQLWWDEDGAQLYVYTGSEWVVAVNQFGGASVTFPASPAANQIVTDSVTGATWRWDAPTTRWVSGATDAPSDGEPYARQDGAWTKIGGDAPPVVSGPTQPPGPNNEGDLWFNTTTGQLMVYQSGNWVLSTAPVEGFLPLAGGTLFGQLQVMSSVSVAYSIAGLSLNLMPSSPFGALAIRYDAPRKNIMFAGGFSAYWDTSNYHYGWQRAGTDFIEWRYVDLLAANYQGTFGGQSAFVNVSDVRAKANIQPEARGLDTILKLQPKAFEKGVQPRDAPRRRRELGFLAQDVESVLPEAVVPLGFPLPDGSGGLDSDRPTLGLTETAIIPVLVNAVKQLAAKVEALEAKL